MDKHEAALKLISDRLEALGKEMREAQEVRLDAVAEIKTTTFQPRKDILWGVANAAWDKAVELALESLNLASSFRELEDLQEKALAK